jgi:hypothetical protein
VYEARPTGFVLAREANRRGLDVRVVAPGSIPKGAGDRVKTDRRDAMRLVRLLAAGELRFTFVPTVEDEAFRDLIRCIGDLRGDLMRARHRVSKFLLRRGQRGREAGAPPLLENGGVMRQRGSPSAARVSDRRIGCSAALAWPASSTACCSRECSRSGVSTLDVTEPRGHAMQSAVRERPLHTAAIDALTPTRAGGERRSVHR